MNATQTTMQQKREAMANRIYQRLMAETPELRNPNSSYWQLHFQAVVKRVVELVGRERYAAWYEQAFPDEEVRQYSWKEKFEGANGWFKRLIERPREAISNQQSAVSNQ